MNIKNNHFKYKICSTINTSMLRKYKSILTAFLMVNFYFMLTFVVNANVVDDSNLDSEIFLQNNQPQNQDDYSAVNVDEVIARMFNDQRLSKPIEEITLSDIIRDENISPEVKERISKLINQSQYQLDRYRTAISNHYKQVENKLITHRKELDDMYNFKDNMEANLNLAKWMIISLSIGIICLTTIVVVMWKSVVNVNRNDVEVLFSTEKVKKDLRLLSKRIEILETAYKKDGK